MTCDMGAGGTCHLGTNKKHTKKKEKYKLPFFSPNRHACGSTGARCVHPRRYCPIACTASSHVSAALAFTTTTPASTSHQAASSNNNGAVVGEVLGGLCGLAVMACIVYALIRWRRRHRHDRIPPPAMHSAFVFQLRPETRASLCHGNTADIITTPLGSGHTADAARTDKATSHSSRDSRPTLLERPVSGVFPSTQPVMFLRNDSGDADADADEVMETKAVIREASDSRLNAPALIAPESIERITRRGWTTPPSPRKTTVSMHDMTELTSTSQSAAIQPAPQSAFSDYAHLTRAALHMDSNDGQRRPSLSLRPWYEQDGADDAGHESDSDFEQFEELDGAGVTQSVSKSSSMQSRSNKASSLLHSSRQFVRLTTSRIDPISFSDIKFDHSTAAEEFGFVTSRGTVRPSSTSKAVPVLIRRCMTRPGESRPLRSKVEEMMQEVRAFCHRRQRGGS